MLQLLRNRLCECPLVLPTTKLPLIDILVVQAETKLQEHGLQLALESREDTQITAPGGFMQTMTPQSLGINSAASQTLYDVELQGDEEMDFSDINFAEFSELDYKYAHFVQLPFWTY